MARVPPIVMEGELDAITYGKPGRGRSFVAGLKPRLIVFDEFAVMGEDVQDLVDGAVDRLAAALARFIVGRPRGREWVWLVHRFFTTQTDVVLWGWRPGDIQVGSWPDRLAQQDFRRGAHGLTGHSLHVTIKLYTAGLTKGVRQASAQMKAFGEALSKASGASMVLPASPPAHAQFAAGGRVTRAQFAASLAARARNTGHRNVTVRRRQP